MLVRVQRGAGVSGGQDAGHHAEARADRQGYIERVTVGTTFDLGLMQRRSPFLRRITLKAYGALASAGA
jgi:hypothetical protein